MGKTLRLLCAILWVGGCTSPAQVPLPENHPAYGFYQTASLFHVSSSECSKLDGSLGIRPDQIGSGLAYEKVKEFAPGLFLVKQTATQKQFVAVIFMENGLVTSFPRTCSWDVEKFPVSSNSGTASRGEQQKKK